MPEQIVINSLEFARSGEELHGKMPVANFGRLADYLYSESGEIEYSLSGSRDKEGKPFLHCDIRGELQLICQRCLGALAFPLDISSDLELVADEGDLAGGAEEEDSHDAIVAEPELDVAALIEDELLLALPISPRHAEGECALRQPAEAGAARQNPFQALAGLKQGKPK
ncbi:MAG: YceD family protein [Pseudomonadota bacterium]|jgi:uncharacterized protein